MVRGARGGGCLQTRTHGVDVEWPSMPATLYKKRTDDATAPGSCRVCCVLCMFVFGNTPSPSFHVADIIRKNLPHLTNRGAKIERVSDTLLILQDIDEWLWQDAQMLSRNSKYQLVIHVYSSVSTVTDGLNGLVVSINTVRTSRVWALLQGLTSVTVCVVFFLWVQYVYMSDSVQQTVASDDAPPPIFGL